MKPKLACPACGQMLRFADVEALRTLTELEQQLRRLRSRANPAERRVRLPLGPAPISPEVQARIAEGEELSTELHDHVHQIAHVTGARPLADLQQASDTWLASPKASSPSVSTG